MTDSENVFFSKTLGWFSIFEIRAENEKFLGQVDSLDFCLARKDDCGPAGGWLCHQGVICMAWVRVGSIVKIGSVCDFWKAFFLPGLMYAIGLQKFGWGERIFFWNEMVLWFPTGTKRCLCACLWLGDRAPSGLFLNLCAVLVCFSSDCQVIECRFWRKAPISVW